MIKKQLEPHQYSEDRKRVLRELNDKNQESLENYGIKQPIK